MLIVVVVACVAVLVGVGVGHYIGSIDTNLLQERVERRDVEIAEHIRNVEYQAREAAKYRGLYHRMRNVVEYMRDHGPTGSICDIILLGVE